MTIAPMRVDAVETCQLEAVPGRWGLSEREGTAIERYWARAKSQRPQLFNGRIYMAAASSLNGRHFSARLVEADFKSFLYWRDTGHPDRELVDCFGSALIRSACGAIVLGCQRPGNINAGLAYLPGGFIDPRDVAGDGRIDIDASVRREIGEETGLAAHELAREPGYLVTRAQAMISIAVPFRSRLAIDELLARIGVHIAAEGERSELSGAIGVARLSDLARLEMPPYARALLPWVLGRS